MTVEEIVEHVAGYVMNSERYLEALMQECPLGASPTQTTLGLTRRLDDTLDFM